MLTKESGLSSEALRSLHDLWTRTLRRRAVSQTDLRRIAQYVARSAVDSDLTPERFIIAVKQTWVNHPDLVARYDADLYDTVLREFVVMCITEYYGLDIDDSGL